MPAITKKESDGLDKALKLIKELNAVYKEIGVKEDDSISIRTVFRSNPFEGLLGTPHLDKIDVGTPLLTEEELVSLEERVSKAKNDREKFYEVVGLLAQIGAGIAKAMA